MLSVEKLFDFYITHEEKLQKYTNMTLYKTKLKTLILKERLKEEIKCNIFICVCIVYSHMEVAKTD